MSFTSWMVRRTLKKGDDVRDAGLTTPPDVRRFDDILYGTDPTWQKLDVYRPADLEGPLPVIVSVHGGAWCYGDKELYQFYCMSLARRGFAVVNFTYRLAPEFKFPAAMEDINLVMEWVLDRRSVETYGFDADHIFMVGDSAGAHMAALYACICTSPRYAAHYSFRVPKRPGGRSFVPDGLGLNCGVYAIDLKRANRMTRNLMKDLLPRGGDREEMYMVQVIPHVGPDFPPSYVMTANGDQIAGPPSQKAFTDRLRRMGICFIDRTCGKEEAPLPHVFHLNMKLEEAHLFNDEQCSFFRSLMAEERQEQE